MWNKLKKNEYHAIYAATTTATVIVATKVAACTTAQSKLVSSTKGFNNFIFTILCILDANLCVIDTNGLIICANLGVLPKIT